MKSKTRFSIRTAMLVGIGAGGVLSSSAHAKDLFTVTAGGASASGSSVVDLVEDLVRARGAFAGLGAGAYTGSLNYGGVPGALNYAVNAAGTSATLTSSITGLSRTFSAANRDALYNQIEDYLEEDGTDDLGDLYKQLNRRSFVAITDGTPHASTALAANQVWNSYSTRVGTTEEELSRGGGLCCTFGLGAGVDVGSIEANGFSGTSVTMPLSMRSQLSERVGLGVDIPLNWTQIENADIFNAGVVLGLPITLIKEGADSPLNWIVAPVGHVNAVGSEDMANGGLIGGGSLASVVSYRLPNNMTLSMGNQISAFEGVEVSGFTPGVSNQLLKNGLTLSIPIAERWVFETRGLYTSFLQDAAVDGYWTVGGDLVYRFLGDFEQKSKRAYAMLGVYGDIAKNYSSPHVRLGTGWKF